MNALETIFEGVKTFAPLAANMVLPGTGPLVNQLIRTVTGDDSTPLEDLAKQVQNDPRLWLEFQKAVLDQEARLAHAEAAKLRAVNETMQAEARSEHWPQWLWRPLWGLTSALCFMVVCFLVGWLVYQALTLGRMEALTAIPQVISAFAALFAIPGAILGVTAWHRGKKQRIQAGEQLEPGLLNQVVSAFRK